MFILCCSCSNLNIMKYNDSKKTVTFFSQLLLAALEVMNIIYVALFFFFFFKWECHHIVFSLCLLHLF